MHILVATSGSQQSQIAVHIGIKLASLAQRPHKKPILTLLTVIRRESERQRAEAILEQAAAMASAEHIIAEARIRTGYVADEIIREARTGREVAYDLVILGMRPGVSTLRAIFGTLPERILYHLPCPLIVAKADVSSLQRVLICEGGLEEDPLPARIQKRLPDIFGPDIEMVVLHVMSQISAAPGVRGWQLRADAQELIQAHTPEGEILERDINLLKEVQFQPKVIVRHGLVVDEILAEAEEGDYSLTIIGAHRLKGEEHFLLDDLAHQIIQRATRPLMIVPKIINS